MIKKNFDTEIAELWDITSNRLRNKEAYVKSLEDTLKREGITKKSLILDVAGGFGFPAIDLAKKGYQIVYLDGSPGMLEKAMRNADLAEAPSYIFSLQQVGETTVSWQDYHDSLASNFWNGIICTGNSLPYVASWGKRNPNLVKSKELIKSTLKQFYRILTKKGVLFVDKQPEKQDYGVENVGEVEIGGKKLHITCSMYNNKFDRVRNWTLKTKNLKTGEVKEYPSKGYLLLEDELIPMLNEIGFNKVKKRVLDGDIYEGFVASKS